MIQTLLDTNIILDIALKRLPYFESSSQIFEKIGANSINGYVAATTIADIYYIVCKEKGATTAKDFISNLIKFVDVLGVHKDHILHALGSKVQDFEDAIQSSVAEHIGINILITRNTKDYIHSPLFILTPEQFIKHLEETK